MDQFSSFNFLFFILIFFIIYAVGGFHLSWYVAEFLFFILVIFTCMVVLYYYSMNTEADPVTWIEFNFVFPYNDMKANMFSFLNK